MLLLPFDHQLLFMRSAQDLQNDPFGNLRPVDSRRIGKWDICIFPDGSRCETVSACADKMDELQVLGLFWCRVFEQGHKDRNVFQEIYVEVSRGGKNLKGNMLGFYHLEYEYHWVWICPRSLLDT